jgi:hypothetical protein
MGRSSTALVVGALITCLMLAMMMFVSFGPLSERGIGTSLAEAAPAVEVTLDCDSNPEKTQVKNNTNRLLTIKTVGSTYQPYPYEPFVVNRTLKPHRTITFQSGSRAKGRNELTNAYIYNNDVGSKEGARVRTSVGTFVDKCTAPAEAATAVEVTVNCDSDPEKTQVRNNTNRVIEIETVGSLYRPYSYEPFVVNRELRPGRAITFQSGSKAKGRNELTNAYIYNSDVGSREGARVRTSVGTFIDKC